MRQGGQGGVKEGKGGLCLQVGSEEAGEGEESGNSCPC